LSALAWPAVLEGLFAFSGQDVLATVYLGQSHSATAELRGIASPPRRVSHDARPEVWSITIGEQVLYLQFEAFLTARRRLALAQTLEPLEISLQAGWLTLEQLH
jgi:hypothetical protein